MPASHWKGFISFGLVSIPVFLYPAKNRDADINFHQIDKTNNARIHYERINSVTGKKVAWEDVTRAYEYDRDTMIAVPDEVLKKVAGSKSRSIEIDSFIAEKSLNLLMLENVYYLVPDQSGQKGYVILRNALHETGRVGIARVIISTKQYLVAIMPFQNALVLCLLKYDNEMKKPDEFDLPAMNACKIKSGEMQIAKQLIQSMTVKWHPEKYVDEYRKSIQQWIRETVNHLPHKKKKEQVQKKISSRDNLIDLLKKSLQAGHKRKGKKEKMEVYKSHKLMKSKAAHRRIMH